MKQTTLYFWMAYDPIRKRRYKTRYRMTREDAARVTEVVILGEPLEADSMTIDVAETSEEAELLRRQMSTQPKWSSPGTIGVSLAPPKGE